MPIGKPITLTNNVASRIVSATATEGQTTFTVSGGYRINAISVFRNGVRLDNSLDFIASDGASVVLTVGAGDGDEISFQIFDDFRVADAIVSAASTQTIYGDLTVTGTVSGASIGIQSSGNLVGAAQTINFTGPGLRTVDITSSTANVTVGIDTSTVSSDTVTTETLNVNGNATVDGTLTATATTASSLSANATGNNLTLSGDLTVNGTQTILNTEEVNISDKKVGIASTTTPTDVTADGAGIQIFGTTDKTLLWERDTGNFEFSDPTKFKGVTETVAVASTESLGDGRNILYLNVRNASTFTYNLANGVVGLVSFTNVPADTGVQNGSTMSVIFTQNSAGTANTTTASGIGTLVHVRGYEDGAQVAGVTTAALVGSGTRVLLSSTGLDRDFVSFFVHYTGGTNTDATSYQVYATKNGGFRQG